MLERPKSGRGIARVLVAVVAMAICVLAAPYHVMAGDKGPTVFAAASLKTALDAVAADWKEDSGQTVVISYAATSALAKQIEQLPGGPDEVASPDIICIEYLFEIVAEGPSVDDLHEARVWDPLLVDPIRTLDLNH